MGLAQIRKREADSEMEFTQMSPRLTCPKGCPLFRFFRGIIIYASPPREECGKSKILINLQKTPNPAAAAPQSLAKSGACRKGARPMYRIAKFEMKNRAFEGKRLDDCIFPRLAERDHGQSALSGSRYCFQRQTLFVPSNVRFFAGYRSGRWFFPKNKSRKLKPPAPPCFGGSCGFRRFIKAF